MFGPTSTWPFAKHHVGGVAAVVRGRERREALADLPRGVLRGLAVQVAAGRRRGRRGVGDLLRVGRGDAHAVEIDAELVRDDLRDLGVEPLAHLGAAVVDEDRAVAVDVHQRAGLVQVHQVERDAELDRRQREAALQHRASRVELRDRVAALAVAAVGLELRGQLVQDVVVDGLPVRRDVALAARRRSSRAARRARRGRAGARSCRGCSRSRSRPAGRRSRGTRCCSACGSGPNSRGSRHRRGSRRCRSGRSPASSPGPRGRPNGRRRETIVSSAPSTRPASS